jgi:hypothetical protein
MQSVVTASRKLEMVKLPLSSQTPTATNQMFIMGISNTFALEAWYPYTNLTTAVNGVVTNAYPRPLEVWTSISTTTTLVDKGDPTFNQPAVTQAYFDYRTIPVPTAGGPVWGGNIVSNRFFVPPVTNYVVLPDSAYVPTCLITHRHVQRLC